MQLIIFVDIISIYAIIEVVRRKTYYEDINKSESESTYDKPFIMHE